MSPVPYETVSFRNTSARVAPISAEPVAPARSGRPRDEEREKAILQAAIELVAEVGYDRMSVDAVASRAHASKATIYRRWPGKAELVAEAVRQQVGDKDLPAPTGDIRADLLALLRAMRTHMEGQDGALVLGLLLAARQDPDLASAFEAQFDDSQMCAATSDLVARAVAAGQLPATAQSQLIDDLLPAILLYRHVQGADSDDAYLTGLIDHVLLPVLYPSVPHRTVPTESDTPLPVSAPPTPPTPQKEARS